MCVTSEFSGASIARAPWSACPDRWIIFPVAKKKKWAKSHTNASIPPQGRRARARHCRRKLRITLGDVSVVPPAAEAGFSSARLFLSAGAFLTQKHGGTRGCASPFCLPSFCVLRQALQNGASNAPDAFAVAALAALVDTTRGVPRDDGIGCATQTRYHHHTRATLVNKDSLAHDERQNGRSWRLRHHERRLTW